jgi:septum formation protein
VRLVLASQSPRRRQLLEQSGLDFEVVAPSAHAECGVCSSESTGELVARLAFQKAADVATKVSGSAVIIACDTVADIMGRVLGKPHNREHAEEMLRMLSGREHAVYSGLCVLPVPGGTPIVEVEKSVLYMQPLSEAQIEQYLDSDAWAGKSGAFGYQDNHPWLQLLSGTADNVVGLPMDNLQRVLARLNCAPQ